MTAPSYMNGHSQEGANIKYVVKAITDEEKGETK